MTQFIKVYVAVILRVDEDGRMAPLAIEWEDGRRFDITKVADVRQAPPRHNVKTVLFNKNLSTLFKN